MGNPMERFRMALAELEGARREVEAHYGLNPDGGSPKEWLRALEAWGRGLDRLRQPVAPGTVLELTGRRAGERIVVRRVDRRWVYDTQGQRYCRTTGYQRDAGAISGLDGVDRARIRRCFDAKGHPRTETALEVTPLQG